MSPLNSSAATYDLPQYSPKFTGQERILLDPSRFAVFHTVAMDDAMRKHLLDSVTKVGTEDANHSALGPNPDFSGKTVRDVYEHFIVLREEDENIQPYYFIVADRLNFEEEGVLGVYLDCAGDRSNEIGVARCPVEKADGWGADFYYGLATFEAMKEEEDVEFGEGGGGDESAEEEEWEGPVRLRGMYGVYSLVDKDLPTENILDPQWLERNPEERRFKVLGNFYASEDPWKEISKQHPGHAALRQRIHRQIVLVVEKKDVNAPDGVAIVRLESDRRPRVLARVDATGVIVEADASVKRLELWNPWEPASYRNLM